MINTIIAFPSDFKFELLGLKPFAVTDQKQMFSMPDEDPLLLTIDPEIMIEIISTLTSSGIKVVYPSDIISDEFNPTSNLRGTRGFKTLTTAEALDLLRVDPAKVEELFGEPEPQSADDIDKGEAGLEDYES